MNDEWVMSECRKTHTSLANPLVLNISGELNTSFFTLHSPLHLGEMWRKEREICTTTNNVIRNAERIKRKMSGNRMEEKEKCEWIILQCEVQLNF